jgi:lipopolysaccharide export system permease protein
VKRLDKLILVELFGPWAFGVAIFTALIMAGTYLFTLTSYIVSGAPAKLIIEMTFLMLPGVMVKTFSMAVLLSTLLSFGRLSSDSEIVALKAAGTSLPRMMMPVAAFGIVVALLAFVTNEKIVAHASNQGEAVKREIQKYLQGSATAVSYSIPGDNGRIKAQVMATGFDVQDKTLSNVTMSIYDSKGMIQNFVYSPRMQWKGDRTDIYGSHWSLSKGTELWSADATFRTKLGPTHPEFKIPESPPPDDILASTLNDLDALDMSQIREAAQKLQKDASADPSRVANLWFGYYNKIALPLTAVIFGLVGAPLSIRPQRTGTATGFWLSVIIIFAYMMLTNLMNIYAMGQKIPPYVASFTPLAIGLVFAIGLIYRKNR